MEAIVYRSVEVHARVEAPADGHDSGEITGKLSFVSLETRNLYVIPCLTVVIL